MNWISVKEKKPPRSFVINSEDQDEPYEANMVLFYFPDAGGEAHIQPGVYEEEDLKPFPNIPKWMVYLITDDDGLWTETKEPTHWMPLPEFPKQEGE